VLALLAGTALAQSLEERARPLVQASHAEIRAVHLGRYMSRARWEEILDEALYALAPKGRWGPDHPAWPAAREALSRAMREASVESLRDELGEHVRTIINERYSLDDEQVKTAAAFYESPGGRVFRDYREKVLAEMSYGLPFVIEAKSHEVYERELEDAKQKLLNLPEEQTAAVFEFNQTELGKLLLGIENNIVADVVANFMRSELHGILIEHGETIAQTVRAKVKNIPPPSEKDYLGTVTMRADGTLDVKIEYHESYRTAGTYELSYQQGSPQWRDVVAGVPGIAEGETRHLYRDRRGRLSDAP
jgi:hypothetical protein